MPDSRATTPPVVTPATVDDSLPVGAPEGPAAEHAVRGNGLDPTLPAVLTVTAGSKRRSRGRGVVFWLALVWLAVVVLVALTASWLPLSDPDKQDLVNRLAPPLSDGHVLGTDGLGRDILARLAFGARVSLIISVSAVSIGMLVGGTIGLAVGFFRGWFESVTMWALNVVLAFPGLVLLLGLVAFVGQSLTAITLVVGFLSVPVYARVARATTLAAAQRDYVLAARALGASNRRIMFGEILPNVALPVAAFGLVALGVVIVLEGSLAFLGLSVKAPDPTWGSMIAEGRQHLSTTTHLAFIPALVMFLTVLAVNFVGDVLRSRFDVRESRL
ncbi:MAG TPA: ABC transporter permease [Acidimicrobiales bacterium]|nr:ABC transporter permease [Acidimicrobiales bacterium]